MKESVIERHVIRYAKSLNCLVYKLTGKNDPDRIFVTPDGHVFFIEFKAPGLWPRISQRHEHARLEELGHTVYVVDDRLHGENIINRELGI